MMTENHENMEGNQPIHISTVTPKLTAGIASTDLPAETLF